MLAWLLGEPAGEQVRTVLGTADAVLASELTLVECDRVLIRAETANELSAGQAADLRGHLNAAAARWNLLRIDGEVVERARRPFPAEPIRTLDALHLASALVARAAIPGLALLTLDGRIRRVARQLGLALLPS